jgi:hypothetical protein
MSKFFSKILLGAMTFGFLQSCIAQKVSDKKPWSVRMVESEMIRCPEAWQLDFQPKLKWDYCHGLELWIRSLPIRKVHDCSLPIVT